MGPFRFGGSIKNNVVNRQHQIRRLLFDPFSPLIHRGSVVQTVATGYRQWHRRVKFTSQMYEKGDAFGIGPGYQGAGDSPVKDWFGILAGLKLCYCPHFP